jgi:hypothetical protein
MIDFNTIFSQWKPVELLRQLARDSEPVFLVGGAVRDLLLNKKRPHDLDVVMLSDVRPLARRLAKALNGDFFMLDDERNTARVLLGNQVEGVTVIDFAQARGGSLTDDLWERDFSINAMALPISQNSAMEVIDPTGGLKDLQSKLLRQVRADSFERDPIRVMRGARLAIQFSLRLHAGTWQAMKTAAPQLENTSAERRRDELFRILEGRKVSSALRLLDQAGVLVWVTPELLELKGVEQSHPHHQDVWEHTLSCVDELENVLNALAAPFDENVVSNLRMGLAVPLLGKFRERLIQHIVTEVTPGRTVRGLLFFGALYHDAGKPAVSKWDGDRIRFFNHEEAAQELISARGRGLALSQNEIARISAIVREHMRVHHLVSSGGKPSRRAIHRFFRDAGIAGVDVCLLSLADSLATYRPDIPQDLWLSELEVCQSLMEAWWERQAEVVAPSRLINGGDVMAAGITAGPRVGKALEAVLEAQAEGLLHTREEALDFLASWIAAEGQNEESNH